MLEVDDAGVTSRGWLRTRSLGWDEIRDYRIRVRPYWTTRLATMNEWPRRRAEHAPAAESDELAFGDMHLRLELHGDDVTLVGDGEGLDGLALSNAVLPRLHRQLAVAAGARFGALAISDSEIRWGDRAPLARAQVDAIRIVVLAAPAAAGGRVELRVTGEGRLYCASALDELPNLGGLVDVAAQLGYRVHGRDLLAALGIVA